MSVLDVLRPRFVQTRIIGGWLAARPLAHFAQGAELEKFDKTAREYGQHILEVDSGHPANCVISGKRSGDSDEVHWPMLDDDDGIFKVVRSRESGHQHVYIDKPIKWADYCRLLELLSALGLVDAHWAKLSVRQRAATLRLPV